MRNRLLAVILLCSTPLAFASIAAQTAVAQTPLSHDLSGVWINARDGRPAAVDTNKRPPMTPWAQARFDAAVPTVGPRVIAGKENDPILRCNPDGLPKLLIVPQPFEIIQIPNRTLMFFEHNRHWRTIWTDGRKLPEDPDPAWMGYSIGKWEGDTFVVESAGFNDIPWLDFNGDPHSDAMKIVERYRRLDHDTLEIQVTIDDPKAYTQLWVNGPKTYNLHEDWEIGEHYCVIDEENAYGDAIRVPAGQSSPK
jgi:hypothetical protein